MQTQVHLGANTFVRWKDEYYYVALVRIGGYHQIAEPETVETLTFEFTRAKIRV
jgi:hypothetical protein